MRKIISLFLTLALIAGLCSWAGAEESYNLDIYWVGNGDNPKIRQGVEKAINRYIEPRIGATVTFHIIGWDDWNTQAIDALRAGTKMDLIFTADWEGYSDEVSEGLLLPLDDLIEEYGSGIHATLPKSFLNGIRVNGIVYGVPTNKELCVPQGFIINKTAAEAIGWDVVEDDPSITCTADLEPWLEKYKKKFPKKYPYLMDGMNNPRWADEPWIPEWAGIANNGISMRMAKQDDGQFDETIVNIFSTPEEEEHIRLMRKWGLAKYIDPAILKSNFDYNGTFGKGDFLVFVQPLKGHGIKAAEMIAANATAEFECVEITMQPKYVVTTHAGGSMFAIPVTCQDPSKAMRYLNLMHSDPALINMMLYGQENVNYETTDLLKLDTIPEANWYGVHGGAWTVGNTRLQYVLSNEDVKKNAYLQVYADDAIPAPSLGFRFDRKNVRDQVDAVNAVISQYGPPLLCGQVDPDDPKVGIAAMNAALKEAGVDEVIAEIQRQYDEWKKTKE